MCIPKKLASIVYILIASILKKVSSKQKWPLLYMQSVKLSVENAINGWNTKNSSLYMQFCYCNFIIKKAISSNNKSCYLENIKAPQYIIMKQLSINMHIIDSQLCRPLHTLIFKNKGMHINNIIGSCMYMYDVMIILHEASP